MVNIVVAVGKNNVIGKDNLLPWDLPNVIKKFKQITEGQLIIMGRKTYEVLKNEISNNGHFVLSRNEEFNVYGKGVVFHDMYVMLRFIKDTKDDFYVIGGGDMYKQFLPYTDRVYMAEVENEIEGDTYFPELSNWEWIIKEQKEGKLDKENIIPHKFITLERKFKVLD